MNKKYIDFVPKVAVKQEPLKVASDVEVVREEVRQISLPRKSRAIDYVAMDTVVRTTDIESVKAKKIPKISLSRRKKTSSAKEAERIAEEIAALEMEEKEKIQQKPGKTAEKTGSSKNVSDERTMKAAVSEADDLGRKLKIPKVAFVNTEKVIKRPLSKNVYTKKIETPKEEPKGPVTIIAKPEKDSKMGLIVTIIITIILGAAAGTVAFLLLPK